jgi:hypothetical protein
VVVAGGFSKLFGSVPIASTLVRIYENGQWHVAAGHLNYGRLEHGALLLPSGKVLLAGGLGQSKEPLHSIELFDPQTGMCSLLPSMQIAREHPRLNLLPDGRVLITGSETQAEILAPSDTAACGYVIRFSKGKSYTKHTDHVAISLSDGSGDVMLFGGRTTTIERFDCRTETFSLSRARLPKVLDDQAAAVLYDGRILLAGGQEVWNNLCISDTWLYNPADDSLIAGPLLKPTAKTADGKIPGGNRQLRGASDVAAVDLFGYDAQKRGRYILLCGGEDDPGKNGSDRVLDFAMVYDAEHGKLIEVGPMLSGHDDFEAVLLKPVDTNAAAQVLIIAGYGMGDVCHGRCELFSWR